MIENFLLLRRVMKGKKNKSDVMSSVFVGLQGPWSYREKKAKYHIPPALEDSNDFVEDNYERICAGSILLLSESPGSKMKERKSCNLNKVVDSLMYWFMGMLSILETIGGVAALS